MNIFAGAGFAQMAWRLAQVRMGKPSAAPLTRNQASRVPVTWPSAEFYRITDRAATAWTDYAYDRSQGASLRVTL